MVQPQDQLPRRDFYPPREHGWLPTRPFLEMPLEGRFSAHPTHKPFVPVKSALNNCAGIFTNDYALIYLNEDKEVKTAMAPSLRSFRNQIFTPSFKRDFLHCVQSSQECGEDDFAGDFGEEIRRQSSSGGSSSGGRSRRKLQLLRSDDSDDDDGAISGKRKRSRPTLSQKRLTDKATVPVINQHRLTIGDSAAVEQLYLHRFMDMQQSSCKVMAKAFVKLVEPKKQSNHPYTKGNLKAPPWWPNTEGANSVTHKEPDHLKKPERLRLLLHILRMIVEPRERQCPSVQKLELNIETLRRVTEEAMKNWFKESPDNAAKEVHLKEIFKVARLEERFRNGEVDGTAKIWVTPFGDKNRINVSDDEEPDDELKAEEAGQEIAVAPVTTPMSDGMISPTTMKHSRSLQGNDPGEFYKIRAAPIRHYNQTPLDDQIPFGDGSYIPRGFQPESPAELDANHRIFRPNTFQPPGNVYNDWQNNMANNGALSTPYYISDSPQAVVPQSSPYSLGPSLSQDGMLPQRLNQTRFDLPTGGFDSAPVIGNQLRTGSLHHPHQVPQQLSEDFRDYLHHSGPYGPHDPGMKDEHGAHSS